MLHLPNDSVVGKFVAGLSWGASNSESTVIPDAVGKDETDAGYLCLVYF